MINTAKEQLETKKPTGWFIAALKIFLALILLAIVVLSAVPPVSRDALTHHLAVPKLYLQRGGIYEIPSVLFSYYPMNLDLLYLLPLYWGNDILPKYIHFAFALLTSGVIFIYLKKRINVLYAWVGVAFFMTIPVILKLSTTVYVDLGLIFFTTTALFFVMQWIEHRFKLVYLMISAVFCGLALGTKYNGLLVLALLGLLVPFVYSRMSGGGVSHTVKSAGFGLIFCLIALTVFSPWMIRNYRWTGNPVYPLFQSLFRPEKASVAVKKPSHSQNKINTVTLAPEKQAPAAKLNHLSYRREVYQESWWEIALVPLRIFFQGKDDQPRFFDGRLNPFLFFLPVFAFAGLKQDSMMLKTEKWIWASFVLLYVLIAFVYTSMRIRYVSPVIPPLVILSMFGLQRTGSYVSASATQFKRWSHVVVMMITMTLLTLNTVYLVEQFRQVRPMDYLSGKLSRDEYIERYRGEYPVCRYANQHLPPDVTIARFFLGNRIYYCDRKTISGTGPFAYAVKRFDSAEALAKLMKEKNITHLFIRKDLFNRWIADNFTGPKRKIIEDFFRYRVKLLFERNGYGLFELI